MSIPKATKIEMNEYWMRVKRLKLAGTHFSSINEAELGPQTRHSEKDGQKYDSDEILYLVGKLVDQRSTPGNNQPDREGPDQGGDADDLREPSY